MIFVTVGSFHFDELVRETDLAVGRGEIAGEITIQIGSGAYTPIHCPYFRSSPGLDAYYERAHLVIGHGGTGTTLEVLERGLPLISICNPGLAGNHQHEFLQALERRGLLIYCRNLKQLPDLVKLALENNNPRKPFSPEMFFRRISHDLDLFCRKKNQFIKGLQ